MGSDFAGVLAAGGVVFGNGEIDRAQQVLERWTCKRHGLNRAVVQRAVRAHQKHAGLAEQGGLFNTDGGLAAAGADVQAPFTGGLAGSCRSRL